MSASGASHVEQAYIVLLNKLNFTLTTHSLQTVYNDLVSYTIIE
jgi:hypothetical protein